MRVHYRREYKGFDIDAQAVELPDGTYGAYVTLTCMRTGLAESKFYLPADETLTTADGALQQAMQYGLDLADGLVSCFDPESMFR